MRDQLHAHAGPRRQTLRFGTSSGQFTPSAEFLMPRAAAVADHAGRTEVRVAAPYHRGIALR